MLKYIVRDIRSVLHFFPYGIVAGIVVFWIVTAKNAGRKKAGMMPVAVMPVVCFYMYLAILLVITFFSRESGSGAGFDLELFSTWGINDRNNAYVIENILLFIPFGWVCALKWRWCRNLFGCALMGGMTSLGIECLQLVSRRGVFQIDDILTNMIGSMIGWLVFWIFRTVFGKKET